MEQKLASQLEKIKAGTSFALDLSKQILTTASVQMLQQNAAVLKNLQKIDLTETKLTAEFSPKIIALLTTFTELTSVNLSFTDITSDFVVTLVEKLPKLEFLYLSSNKLSGITLAQTLAQKATLQYLLLDYNAFGAEESKTLASSKTLQTLLLSHNQIGNEGALALINQGNFTRLELNTNELTDEAGTQMRPSPTLKILKLNGNSELTSATAIALAKTTLWELEMAGANVDDSATTALSQSDLIALNLSATKISTTGAHPFLTNQTLIQLDLDDTPADMAEEHMAEFEAAEDIISLLTNKLNENRALREKTTKITIAAALYTILSTLNKSQNPAENSCFSLLPLEITQLILRAVFNDLKYTAEESDPGIKHIAANLSARLNAKKATPPTEWKWQKLIPGETAKTPGKLPFWIPPRRENVTIPNPQSNIENTTGRASMSLK